MTSSSEASRKVAMVIGAHPDDADFACAGTVASWVREGWRVIYVILTDGSGGGPDDMLNQGWWARRKFVKKLVATRQQEERAAAAALGVEEVIFLGYKDNQLQPTMKLRRELVCLLRRYRPTRVICYSPDRSWREETPLWAWHPDHQASGRAAIEAIYPASQNPWDFPALLRKGLWFKRRKPLEPHEVSEVYFIDAPVCNHTVDVTEFTEEMEQALRAHASQFGGEAGIESMVELQRSIARQNGRRGGVTYAEAFHRKVNV